MSNLDFQMLKWQREVLNEKPRFKVVVAGRRCGKTRFSVVETIIKALQCPDKTGVLLYVAPIHDRMPVVLEKNDLEDWLWDNRHVKEILNCNHPDLSIQFA